MALRPAAIFVFALLLLIASTVAVEQPQEEPYRYERFVYKHPVAVRAPIKFKTCGGYADVSSMDIEPFSVTPKGQYVFKIGETVNVTVMFSLTGDGMKTGKLTIYAKPTKFPAQIKIAEADVCEHHNLDCPLKAGEKYKFVMSLLIERYFPRLPVTVQAEVKYGDKMVLCVNFEAIIKS